MNTYEIFHDAAGWHITFFKNNKVAGWSYNHATRMEAEAAKKSIQFMGEGRGYEIIDNYPREV